MKLNKSVKVLLASSMLLGAVTAACGDDTANGGGAGAAGDDSRADGDTITGPECERPGESTCTGSASGIVCAEGSTSAVPFFCATGEVCDDGACVGQCEGGATECVGESAMRICADDGREWVTVACSDGTTCQDGQCLLPGGFVCTPGEKRCTDAAANQTCKSDGSGWEDAEECPGDSTCSDGECAGSLCVVDATRCDAAATNWVTGMYDAMFFNGDYPDFEGAAGVVYRCVDGEAWVAEPCADETVCTYTNLSASAIATYHAEVSDAFFETGMFEGPTPPYAPPAAPDIPAGSTAECLAIDCPQLMNSGPEGFLMFGQASTSVCGDVTVEDDEEPWKSVSACAGFPILSPVTTRVETCTNDNICRETGPFSTNCDVVDHDEAFPIDGECYPGELACLDGDTYARCTWNGSGSGWSTSDCPPVGEPAAPGACAASGAFPERTATCDGSPIPEPL